MAEYFLRGIHCDEHGLPTRCPASVYCEYVDKAEFWTI